MAPHRHAAENFMFAVTQRCRCINHAVVTAGVEHPAGLQDRSFGSAPFFFNEATGNLDDLQFAATSQ